MPTHTTLTSATAWSPDLTAVPAADAVPDALVLLTSTVAGEVEGDDVAVRCQFVDDADAGFVPEGQPIDEAEPDLAECLVYTGKVAQIVRLSREQWAQPNASTLLSESVSRAVTKAANLAYIAQPIPEDGNTPPAGLLAVAGTEGPAVTDNLDPLIDLQAALADLDGTPTHWVLSPSTWAHLRKIKEGADSNTSLLGAGVQDVIQLLLGLPVLVSSAVPSGSGLLIDRFAVISAAGSVQVAQSEHAYFTADSIALRCTWRFGANVVHPERIAKFSVTTED